MTQQPDHSSRAHSSLSASATERWWPCPRSVLLSEGFPNTSSAFAEEGTAAHELGNICLEKGEDADAYLGKTIHGHVMDEGCVEAVQLYLDECRKYMGEGWVWWVERKFSLESLNPPVPMFGTSDFTAFHAETGRLVVVDYKHGVGVVKKAEGNPQLRYYGLGCWLSLPTGTVVRLITTIIVQPRAPGYDGPKTAEITAGELAEWAMELLERAELTQREDAPMEAGEHCRFCLASPCKEQARAAMESAQADFDTWVEGAEMGSPGLPMNPDLISPEQIGTALSSIDVLEGFVKAIKSKAKTLLEHNVHVPGWSLETMRSNLRWVREEDEDPTAFAGLVEIGCGLPPMTVLEHEPKLRSPAQVRDTLAGILRENKAVKTKKEAKAKAESILSLYTKRPTGGTKIVPLEKSTDPAPLRGDEFAEFLEPLEESI